MFTKSFNNIGANMSINNYSVNASKVLNKKGFRPNSRDVSQMSNFSNAAIKEYMNRDNVNLSKIKPKKEYIREEQRKSMHEKLISL